MENQRGCVDLGAEIVLFTPLYPTKKKNNIPPPTCRTCWGGKNSLLSCRGTCPQGKSWLELSAWYFAGSQGSGCAGEEESRRWRSQSSRSNFFFQLHFSAAFELPAMNVRSSNWSTLIIHTWLSIPWPEERNTHGSLEREGWDDILILCFKKH